MKYARKTVLVDVNNVPSTNKRIEPLTEAINSLVNATEFSRTNYGDSANAVTELDKDLRKILDRKDISLDDKLKLYNQSLSRYLFLQHESKKQVYTNPGVGITPSTTRATSPSASGKSSPTWQSEWEDSVASNEKDFSPPISISSLEKQKLFSPSNSIPFHENKFSTPISSRVIPQRNSHKRDVLRDPISRIPKYKTNLPRTTPKSQILRKERPERRMSGYFVGWRNRKPTKDE